MQTKRIQCPKCSVVLEVKNPKGEELKQIVCPSCKTALQVRFKPQQEPLEAMTYYASANKPAADNGATQLAGGNNGATRLAKPTANASLQACLEYGGTRYPLAEGQNIIGRKGNTSNATIQIDTSDRYMSRQHCSITVTTLPDGSRKAVLGNYQNKNLTTIDGQEIATGDTIRLMDGNSITMGHTTVTFKLS